MAAEQVAHRRARSLVGDMHDVDAGHLLHQFAGEVRRGAQAARCVVERAGLRPREGEQVSQRLRRHARMRDQHHGCGREHRHRAQRLHGVEGHLRLEQPRIDQHRAVSGEQRVAIGCRLHHEFGADDRCTAGAVVEHHWLAERRTRGRADHAQQVVGATARAVRHDHTQRPFRERLRVRGRGQQRQGGRKGHRQGEPARGCRTGRHGQLPFRGRRTARC